MPEDEEQGRAEGATRSRRRRLLRVLMVLVVLLLVLYQTPCIPHYSSSHGVLTVDQARRGCPIGLPASARNVQYRTFIFFQSFEEHVRFEAPAADCVAHVKATIRDWNAGHPSDLQQASDKLRPIDEARRLEHCTIDMPWFDIEIIEHGFEAGSGGTMSPQVWVDTDRGVFYFRVTD